MEVRGSAWKCVESVTRWVSGEGRGRREWTQGYKQWEGRGVGSKLFVKGKGGQDERDGGGGGCEALCRGRECVCGFCFFLSF